MADDDEDGADAAVRLDVEPDRFGVRDGGVLNPPHVRDVARVSEVVDVGVDDLEAVVVGRRAFHERTYTTNAGVPRTFRACFVPDMAQRAWNTSETLENFFGAEVVSTLREVVLMPRNIPPVLPAARPGDDVVVLIHGFLATAGVFRPMKRRLERELGARVASFTHAPGVGVKRIAKQLERLIERIPLGARIHVVGHSLGGVVARWYVQEMEGHRRVAQTISLASPFGGVYVAGKIPVLVGADLEAASVVLDRIRARAHVGAVPHTSIVAERDRLVTGIDNAILPRSEAVVLAGRGHNTLLYDDEVTRIVLERIRRLRP